MTLDFYNYIRNTQVGSHFFAVRIRLRGNITEVGGILEIHYISYTQYNMLILVE